MRLRLRAATQGPHERLHNHAGFGSVAAGTIDKAAYRQLLARLHGFYVPFETAMGLGRERSDWLEADMAALDAGRRPAGEAPLCACLPRLDNNERRLGALYVAEGSALGGRVLAHGLDGLLGPDAAEGRRFFTGRGAATGAGWACYLAQLALVPHTQASWADIEGAAVETFAVFEEWLNGWRPATHG